MHEVFARPFLNQVPIGDWSLVSQCFELKRGRSNYQTISLRWWPSQILDKTDLPDNIKTKARKPCQFPVVCLGRLCGFLIRMTKHYLQHTNLNQINAHT